MSDYNSPIDYTDPNLGLQKQADPTGLPTLGLDPGTQAQPPTISAPATSPNPPLEDVTSPEYINREDNPLTSALMKVGLGSRAHARHVEQKLRMAQFIAQQQDQELTNGQKQLDLMGKQINTLGELNNTDRPAALEMFKQEWDTRGGGLGDLMQHMADSKLAHLADLREMVSTDPTLSLAMKSGGLSKVVEVYNSDKDVRDRAEAFAISKQRGPVLEKSIAALKYLKARYPNELQKAMGDGDIQTEELVNDLNPLLSEDLRFNESDTRLLDIDPVAQRTLGYEPSAKAIAKEDERTKALIAAKVQAQYREPPPGVNVMLPNGDVRISNDRGRTVTINGRNVPTPEGSSLYSSRAQGTLADLNPGPVPGKKERQAAGGAAREAAERIASTTENLNTVLGAQPGVVGATGAIAEGVAGALGQISPDAAEAITTYITGLNPEDLTNLRTNLKVIGPKAIKQFTGEQSGRVTDKELAISADATKAMSPTASKEQVVGGLRALISMDLLTRDRNMRTAGIKPDYDVSTDEGIARAAKDFVHKYGLNPQTASRLIRALARQKELLEESGAKPNAAK